MPKQSDLDSTYMGVAILHSRLSKARRSLVGATLVTSQGVCIPGYNGTPKGMDNDCETITGWEHTEVYLPNTERYVAIQVPTTPILKTKPEVIHAELNCILKAAKEGISCYNSTVYVTLSPCVPCSAMLINAGIKRLVYKDEYRNTEGIDLLKKAGIIVEHYKEGV